MKVFTTNRVPQTPSSTKHTLGGWIQRSQLRRPASTNVVSRASKNGASQKVPRLRKMYIADVDMARNSESPRPRTPVNVPDSRFHPPPTSQAPRGRRSSSDIAKARALVVSNKQMKRDLVRASSEIAEQHETLQMLHAELAEKDRLAQVDKRDVMETRVQLTDARDKLEITSERLAAAIEEKTKYRQHLLVAERELDETQSELLKWSEGLLELQYVMAGLDDSLTDLVGNEKFQETMRGLPGFDGKGPRLHRTERELDLFGPEGGDGEDAFTEALRDLRELSQQVLDDARDDAHFLK